MYIHVYTMLVKHWYTWISKHCITGETLIYMNIKYYKYNWWNIDIDMYQMLSTSITDETLIYMNMKHYKHNLMKHWDTWISNTTSITGETLIYMNIKTLQV